MGRQGLLATVLAPAYRTIGSNHNHLHRAALGMLMTIGILRHIPILALLGYPSAIRLPTMWGSVRKTCLITYQCKVSVAGRDFELWHRQE